MTANNLPQSEPERAPWRMEDYLRYAGKSAWEGNFGEAERLLEEAVREHPAWAAWMAGTPYQSAWADVRPAEGYGLLVHTAAKAGRKDLASRYFKRMLELNPKRPGNAREAAREAKIVKEAREVARQMNFSFNWWEY